MKKTNLNIGCLVKVSTTSQEFLGVLIPSPNKEILALKLESGYNIGIERKNIKKIDLVEKHKKKTMKKEKIAINKKLPTISILHTGGTIASKVDYETGAVTAIFSPEDLLSMFPELKDIANIKSRLISNMLSEDINFKHYNLIAREISKELKNNIEGIILTHGTDTLAYTAAALSFILEDIPIPVILVGAQRSSDRGSSDAFLNLLSAVKFITQTDFSEVAICMHESINDDNCLILPALKTKKLHSSRRDAFKEVNAKPIARISDKIEFLTNYKKKEKRELKLKLMKENLKIGILKSHPNLSVDEIKNYSKFHGLILEGTGLGHFPVNKIDKLTLENEKILNEIKKLAKKIPVVMATQTIFGSVNMNVYSSGRKLLEAGVLGNYADMLSETAYIKLAWLLSNYPKNVKELINKNLRGEITINY